MSAWTLAPAASDSDAMSDATAWSDERCEPADEMLCGDIERVSCDASRQAGAVAG